MRTGKRALRKTCLKWENHKKEEADKIKNGKREEKRLRSAQWTADTANTKSSYTTYHDIAIVTAKAALGHRTKKRSTRIDVATTLLLSYRFIRLHKKGLLNSKIDYVPFQYDYNT